MVKKTWEIALIPSAYDKEKEYLPIFQISISSEILFFIQFYGRTALFLIISVRIDCC